MIVEIQKKIEAPIRPRNLTFPKLVVGKLNDMMINKKKYL